MPPTVEDRLRDILEAIIEIEDVVQGASFVQFASDRRARLLTERLLEIVCEASRTIPEKIKQEEPAIDWRKMIDFGNLLRHAYHTTKAEVVWDGYRESFAGFEVGGRTPHSRIRQMNGARVPWRAEEQQ